MTDEDVTTELAGWTVLHLFFSLSPQADRPAIELAIKDCQAREHQVVTASIFGHQADLAVMALGPDAEELRALQGRLVRAGLQLTYSYLSLTELSEYAEGLPEVQRHARLRPNLPPPEMEAFCFYPMSKRRMADDNWYRLPFSERKRLMEGHGVVGRTFRGRVLQLISGSTGLDQYEWGVTLFATSLEEIKACVYTMRFDEASARYAEFGPFVTGTVGTPAEVLDRLGVDS